MLGSAACPSSWELNPQTQVGKPRSAGLPMAHNRHPHVAKGGALLVGDSGGMVNPFNGEGISYAVEAAAFAGGTAVQATRSHPRQHPQPARALPAAPGRRVGRVLHPGPHLPGGAMGDSTVMRLCTTYGMPRRRIMHFTLKTMAHLLNAPPKDATDAVIGALRPPRPGGLRGFAMRALGSASPVPAGTRSELTCSAVLPARRPCSRCSRCSSWACRSSCPASSGPQPPEPREGRRLRVGDHPGARHRRRRRALPREVLSRRDALHHLRRRGRLPVSLGHRAAGPLLVRPGRDGGVHRPASSSPTTTCCAKGGLEWDFRDRRKAAERLPADHGRGRSRAGASRLFPPTFGLACCAIEMMTTSDQPLRPRALRDGGLPGSPAPGRPHDRRRPGQPEDGAGRPAGL